jgi:Tol biopolymer transport system component
MPAENESRILYRLYSPDGIEIWSKSLDEGSEELVLQGSTGGGARWSRNGEWFCYEKVDEGGIRFVLQSRSGERLNLTSSLSGSLALSGFSSDGRWVLASLPAKDDGGHAEIVKLPIDKAPLAEESAITIASHPDLNLWQPRFSPDDRWVVFVAIQRTNPQGAAA